MISTPRRGCGNMPRPSSGSGKGMMLGERDYSARRRIVVQTTAHAVRYDVDATNTHCRTPGGADVATVAQRGIILEGA